MPLTKPTTNYTVQVFKHWMNLSLLGCIGFLALVGGWAMASFGLLIEVGVLWMVPDFPGVKRSLDNDVRTKKLESQRTYYVHTLWKYSPVQTNPFFAPAHTDWYSALYGSRFDDEVSKFVSLCKTVNELREVKDGQPSSVSEDVLIRIDEMINGYLSLLLVAKTASKNIGTIDKATLAREFEKLRASTQAADPNDKAFRVVLAERLRSIKTKVDSLPRLERRRDLALAQAENIVQAIEASAIQLRTQGALDAGVFADTNLLVDMDNPVDELEIATEVRSLTSSTMELDVLDQGVWDDISSKLGGTPAPALESSSTSKKSKRFTVDM